MDTIQVEQNSGKAFQVWSARQGATVQRTYFQLSGQGKSDLLGFGVVSADYDIPGQLLFDPS